MVRTRYDQELKKAGHLTIPKEKIRAARESAASVHFKSLTQTPLHRIEYPTDYMDINYFFLLTATYTDG